MSHGEARAIFDAHYLPPVAMGDVVRLLERRPTTIAIIDGLFEQTPAVWHKEILHALHQGVRVLGASSMGALRASELHPFGMEGVGAIFEAFRDGVIEDDDEVAVAHGPASASFRPLSDAMVNLRDGLRLARERGVVSAATAEALIATAKGLYYPERTWRAVIAAASGLPGEELAALERFVAEVKPDLKRADAIRLLEHLARGVPRPEPVRFDFEPTYHWELMRGEELAGEPLRALGAEAHDPPLAPEAVVRHLRVRHHGDPSLARDALLYWFLDRERLAEEGAAVPEEEAVPPEDGVPGSLATLLVRLDAVAAGVVSRKRAEVEAFLPLALARRGLWRDTVASLRASRAALAARGLERPTLADAGVTEEQLLAWYAARTGGEPLPLLDQARAAGFETGEELLEELLAQYLAEQPPG